MTEGRDSVDAIDAEDGIAVVRWMFALVGTVAALASRSMLGAVGVMAVSAAAIGLPWLLARAFAGPRDDDLVRRFRVVLVQVVDSALFVIVMVILSDVAADTAWALLAVPIVIAALRLGATGVLGVWLGVVASYLLVLYFDLVAPGREGLEESLIFERPGILLITAACVAILTRWLQAGWALQLQTSEEAQARLRYVQAVEFVGRTQRGLPPERVVDNGRRFIQWLGFEAATTSIDGGPMSCDGDGRIVPADGRPRDPEDGIVEITEWRGNRSELVFSVGVRDPQSGVTFCGWSIEPPDRAQCEALVDLVAQVGSGYELATLLDEARRQADDARQQADEDALTGLANRRAFDRHLDAVADRGTPLAILFVDLDHFKKVNDGFGHEAGDRVLRDVARVIAEDVGDHGLAVRYGGDEFAVVLEGEQIGHTDRLSRHLHKRLGDLRVAGAVDALSIGVSIGVGVAEEAVSPVEVLRAADRAVFAAKDAGRGQTCVVRLGPNAESSEPTSGPAILMRR
ncbi:MAG: GGDEF domain-containing protein [Actinomycetota bacterium]